MVVKNWLSLKTTTTTSIEVEDVLDEVNEERSEERSEGSLSDEEDEEVEDLLYAAQMDLIGHRLFNASTKLRKAVSLNSSAACSTLARLLYKGINTEEIESSTSPNSSQIIYPSQKGNSSRFSISSPRPSPDLKKDRQEAARLFVRGLEIELAKGLKGSETPVGRFNLSRKSSRDNREGMYGSASEEESAEGDFFNLERALDLVVGLTDCYRYGILQAHNFTSTSGVDDLWTRGGKAATLALLHPGISLSTTNEPVLSTSPPGFSGAPLLRSKSTSRSRNAVESPSKITSRASSPKPTTARSYTHPSTSIPAVASFVPSSFQSLAAHHLPPNLKLRLTIQIHLYYLLGLQNWSTEKLLAQGYWNEILKIAGSIGSGVGTKEGDEIVFSATQRLKLARGELIDDGMNSKHRPKRTRSVLNSSLVVEEVSGQSPVEDALEDIWREKSEGLALEQSMKDLRKVKGWKGKGKEVVREEREVISPRNSISVVSNPSNNHDTLLSYAIVGSPTPINSPSTTNSVKIAKFHFATTSDYPSPPETPNPSPPSSNRNHSNLTSSKGLLRTSSVVNFSVEPVTLASLINNSHTLLEELKEPILPSFSKPRRRGSTSSFQPPQLLPRVHSSASISTLPPDFFSTRTRRDITGSNWQSSSRITTTGVGESLFLSNPMSSKVSNITNIVEEGPVVGGKRWIQSRFKSFKSTFTRSEKKITASSVLRNVLNRDDEAAGPGMYWGEEGEGVGVEDAIEIVNPDQAMLDGVIQEELELPSPSPAPSADTSTSKRSRRDGADTTTTIRALQPQRSFVDVTSPRPSNLPPRMTYTPPTPRDTLQLFPSPPNENNEFSLSSSPSPLNSNLYTSPGGTMLKKAKSKRFDSGIDPMLLELERASRVGVRTKCFTCGKKGLNYPATRTGLTYCTRECRMVKT